MNMKYLYAQTKKSSQKKKIARKKTPTKKTQIKNTKKSIKKKIKKSTSSKKRKNKINEILNLNSFYYAGGYIMIFGLFAVAIYLSQ